eukprot:2940776-Rhodomonas_salina.1
MEGGKMVEKEGGRRERGEREGKKGVWKREKGEGEGRELSADEMRMSSDAPWDLSLSSHSLPRSSNLICTAQWPCYPAPDSSVCCEPPPETPHRKIPNQHR